MSLQIEILTGDALVLIQDLPVHSVDLIFTDPPYLKAYLDLYDWLGEQAVRVLKPDGFLLTYVGGYHKARAMEFLNRHLEYYWDFVTLHRTLSSMVWHRKVIARYKSILAYRKLGSKARPRFNVLAVIDDLSGPDKRFHRWGQAETAARYLIECFTQEGDLVLDPFVGGGTTAWVCSRIGRNFIGYEIDPAVAEIARARLAGWKPAERQMMLFDPDGYALQA